jgi:large subunit ribosomal protein L30e
MNELKEKIKNKEIIIGSDLVMKKLKIGKLKKVYVSSNCPKHLKEDIEHYAKLHKVEVKESKETNEELGVLCKKPFTISVLAY